MTFLGRIFETPDAVFTEEMLRPEKQDAAQFAAGADAIVESPPLRALLHIMTSGVWEGKTADHPVVRTLFTRHYLISSDWYAERLRAKQTRDIAFWAKYANASGQLETG